MSNYAPILVAVGLMGCSSAPAQHDFRTAVAVELAAIELESPAPAPNPAPAGDVCPSCNGKGKVGDGTVMVKCLSCDGTGKRKTEAPKEEPKPEPEPAPIVKAAPSKQLLYFTASWCAPCRQVKAEIAKLEAAGWDIGEWGHIRVVDVDQERNLVTKYGVAELPAFVLVENGRELSRATGYQNAASIGSQFYGRAMQSSGEACATEGVESSGRRLFRRRGG